MIASHRSLKTPRRLVVGLLVFAAACHRHRPEAPAPVAPTNAPAAPAAVVVTSAPTLIRAMHDRYPDWYRTLTFRQKTTLVAPSGGEIHQTWYEAASLPGRLRIDNDLASKSGTLFARDSIFAFSQGKQLSAEPGLNELLVLGFDAYRQSTARTDEQLRSLGFDLTRFHDDVWQGKPVFVVGALRGDTSSKQFWIDKSTLLFVRVLEHGRQGRVDIRFNKYQRAGDGWVATEVVQLVNGTRRLLEEYTDVRANVTLSDALFDPKQWATVRHWSVPRSPRY
jgi:hypothetical protein